MKKLLFATLIAGAIASCSSKKDWTCTCTATSGGVSASASTILTELTEDEAKKACSAGNSTYTGGSVTCTPTAK
ncbi:MAG: hypothetical protein NW207_10950 [Cytophagales bacterium]|nr:hypothetical protein [Cytophagales bacterium]